MNTKSNLSFLVGLGAVWGILEATVGWGMHLLHLPYKSLLLFPIGACIMLLGISRTGKARAAVQIATVAALIKLTNLLMPGFFPAYYVVNPAIAIWLEGLAVFAFSGYVAKQTGGSRMAVAGQWGMAVGCILLSQMLFAGWQFTADWLTVSNPALPWMFSAGNLLPLLLQIVLKGGMLTGIACYLMRTDTQRRPLQLGWTWAVSLVLVAFVVDYITL